MELHNILEDIIIPKVEEIFDALEQHGNTDKLCTCSQCRIDTACYVLNRTTPYYIVSNRGAARIHRELAERQQRVTDITSMIYEGLKRVAHNQRPNFGHTSEKISSALENKPAFDIPSITGRLFNGSNFEPIYGVNLELLINGAMVAMKDGNWQNPLHLVSHTEGNFSFWPVPIPAKNVGETAEFEFTIHVDAGEFETLNHVFKINVTSEILVSKSFTLTKTFKLPDLYMFPPGEHQTRSLD